MTAMKKKVSIKLEASSIRAAIKELEDYKKWIIQKTKELNEELTYVGIQIAAERFGAAIYDGTNDVTLNAEPTDNGWVIRAEGQAVCFIEFGAGTYYNGAEPYPSPPGRPAGIVNIGEYGQGKGKRKGWMYYSGDDLVFTRGNSAAMPMYYASMEIQNKLEDVAREVFSQ